MSINTNEIKEAAVVGGDEEIASRSAGPSPAEQVRRAFRSSGNYESAGH